MRSQRLAKRVHKSFVLRTLDWINCVHLQHEPTCMVSGNDGSYQESHQETHPQAYKEAHREAYQDAHQDAHQETYNETHEGANLIAYLDKPLNC